MFLSPLELLNFHKDVEEDQTLQFRFITFHKTDRFLMGRDGEVRGGDKNKDTRSIFCNRPTCLVPRQPAGCAHAAVMID